MFGQVPSEETVYLTNNENEFDDVSNEEEIPRVVETHVFQYTNEYIKLLNEKGKHFIEQNVVLYPQLKDFPNQLFVTSRNEENVNLKLKDLLEEDNKKVSDEGFYSNQKSSFKHNKKEKTSVQGQERN